MEFSANGSALIRSEYRDVLVEMLRGYFPEGEIKPDPENDCEVRIEIPYAPDDMSDEGSNEVLNEILDGPLIQEHGYHFGIDINPGGAMEFTRQYYGPLDEGREAVERLDRLLDTARGLEGLAPEDDVFGNGLAAVVRERAEHARDEAINAGYLPRS